MTTATQTQTALFNFSWKIVDEDRIHYETVASLAAYWDRLKEIYAAPYDQGKIEWAKIERITAENPAVGKDLSHLHIV